MSLYLKTDNYKSNLRICAEIQGRKISEFIVIQYKRFKGNQLFQIQSTDFLKLTNKKFK